MAEMAKHRHYAHIHVTHGWSHCMVSGSCRGTAHGAVVHIDTCHCGATRATESTGRHSASDGWHEPGDCGDCGDSAEDKDNN